MAITISSNEFWGKRSGAIDKNYGSSSVKHHFHFYFQQMQWKPTKGGNSGKTGWKARKGPKNYSNKKLRNRGF